MQAKPEDDWRDVAFMETDPDFCIEYHDVLYSFFYGPWDFGREYWHFDETPRQKSGDADLKEIGQVCDLLDKGAHGAIDPEIFVRKLLGVYVRNNEE